MIQASVMTVKLVPQGLVWKLTSWPLSGSGQESTLELTSGLEAIEEHSGSNKMVTTG